LSFGVKSDLCRFNAQSLAPSSIPQFFNKMKTQEILTLGFYITLFISVAYAFLFKNRNKEQLKKDIANKLASADSSESGKIWIQKLKDEYGPFLAVKSVKHTRGLPGYGARNILETLMGRSDPIDLVVTNKALLIFIPMLSETAQLICIPFPDIKCYPFTNIKRVGEGGGNSSNLYITSSVGTMTFDCGGTLSARPIKEIIHKAMDSD